MSAIVEVEREWLPFMEFTPCKTLEGYIMSQSPTRAIFAGNQSGKTVTAMYDAAMRLLGMHPVPHRNVLNKPIRCVSKCLPKSDADEENQQYVELKRLLPPSCVKRDVTARSPMMIIKEPRYGTERKIEFMSAKQDIDAFMSIQRSALYQDEEIDKLKWDECHMRLLREGGDATITLTPVRGLDWTFDSVWRKAERIYRSQVIKDKFGFPLFERNAIKTGIDAFCIATDDNPVMDTATLDRVFEGVTDPDELAMRRYGIFRQVSGRIYKLFDPEIHCIDYEKMMSVIKPHQCWHYRIIDFHPGKPWYISFVMISPTQEWFVWNEMLGKHEVMTTYDIRDEIKSESVLPEDHMFNRATIIDPLAKVKQPNTGYSAFEDLARGEQGLRRCTAADTKNENGRLVVNSRLKNSITCGVPGNNMNKDEEPDPRHGFYRPTIWFVRNCKGHKEHFMNWRYVDFKQEHVKAVKEVKRVSEKWSDYCRNIEFLGAENPVYYDYTEDEYQTPPMFRGRR